MKILFWLTLFLSTFVLTAQTPNFTALTRSVVRIDAHRHARTADDPADYVESEVGTGVVVANSDGVLRILTARHVVHEASTLTVTFEFNQQKAFPAHLLQGSIENLDIAVIETTVDTGTLRNVISAHLASFPAGSLTNAMHVWSMNGEWNAVPNTTLGLSHDADSRKFEYTSSSLGSGYSGGPVFDDSGRLIGIHTSSAVHSDYKVAVAVKLSHALDALTAVGYALSSWNLISTSANTSDTASSMSPKLPASDVPSPTTVACVAHATMSDGTGPPEDITQKLKAYDSVCNEGAPGARLSIDINLCSGRDRTVTSLKVGRGSRSPHGGNYQSFSKVSARFTGANGTKVGSFDFPTSFGPVEQRFAVPVRAAKIHLDIPASSDYHQLLCFVNVETADEH